MNVESRLSELLRDRILILDGATGTSFQAMGLSEADYRGDRFADHPKDLKGNHDLLPLTRPDAVAEVHDAYLEAGSDIIGTVTFSATSVTQAEYDLPDLDIDGDSTFVMMLEAQQRGHEVLYVDPSDLFASAGRRRRWIFRRGNLSFRLRLSCKAKTQLRNPDLW